MEEETQEHLDLMRLLLCQNEEHSEYSQPKEDPVGEELQGVKYADHTSDVSQNEINYIKSDPSESTKNSCTNLGMASGISFASKEESQFQMPWELKDRNVKESDGSTSEIKVLNICPVPNIEEQSSLCQMPQSSQFDIFQNNVDFSAESVEQLQPFTTINLETLEFPDNVPGLSSFDLECFGSGDMIASSENDFNQMNKIFEFESPKAKKDKHTKAERAPKQAVKRKLDSNMLNEEKVPPWAKAYIKMFRCQQASFKKEKDFNEMNSRNFPHCSICMLLQPRIVSQESSDHTALEKTSKTAIPSKSTPMTVDLLKGRTGATVISKMQQSVLLQCTLCKVCVHAFCYGEDEKNHEWMCARCINGDLQATCCICNLKGGALASTTDNRWCHIVCALINTDTDIGKGAKNKGARLQGIDISHIPKKRKTSKCWYCSSFHGQAEVAGGVVQCSMGRCVTTYHVTCGYAAGVVFQMDAKHFPLFMMCTKHGLKKSEQNELKRKLIEIQVGDKVISKHKSGRYYYCEVSNIEQELFCKALFDDGSLSTNLYPEDFQNLDIRKDGPPKEEAKVKVLWRPDQQIYTAIFKGIHYLPCYEVLFQDGLKLENFRDEVFALSEKLPSRVKSNLFEAVFVKSQGNADETSGRKRVKQPNPLYFGNNYVWKKKK